MKKREALSQNFLEKTPCIFPDVKWSSDEDGSVTLEIENKGLMKRATQLLLKKPKISYIHLEKYGSFIFPLIDGQRNIIEIGKLVEEHFGEEAQPLYERLAQYFKTLEANKFIILK
ncbi:MAG: PqqD family protein [Clostridia bacterium]|nr:PqqD family protein [Clostridia bacterium]